jgi:hypothetical protein
MKKFQLIYVCQELDECSIMISENDLEIDETIPQDEYEKALLLKINETMILHFGENPIQSGNLIRKS